MRLIASGGTKLAEFAPILARTAYYAGAPLAAHTIGSRSFTATTSHCAAQGGTWIGY